MTGSCVYFIQADESGPVKIGFTAENPMRRLNQLQTGNASVLRLLGAIKGTSADEKRLHVELAEWRLQGEWFEPHPSVLATIKAALATSPGADSSSADNCLHCSFCLRSQDDVEILFQGKAGNICVDCIDDAVAFISAHPLGQSDTAVVTSAAAAASPSCSAPSAGEVAVLIPAERAA